MNESERCNYCGEYLASCVCYTTKPIGENKKIHKHTSHSYTVDGNCYWYGESSGGNKWYLVKDAGPFRPYSSKTPEMSIGEVESVRDICNDILNIEPEKPDYFSQIMFFCGGVVVGLLLFASLIK